MNVNYVTKKIHLFGATELVDVDKGRQRKMVYEQARWIRKRNSARKKNWETYSMMTTSKCAYCVLIVNDAILENEVSNGATETTPWNVAKLTCLNRRYMHIVVVGISALTNGNIELYTHIIQISKDWWHQCKQCPNRKSFLPSFLRFRRCCWLLLLLFFIQLRKAFVNASKKNIELKIVITA